MTILFPRGKKIESAEEVEKKIGAPLVDENISFDGSISDSGRDSTSVKNSLSSPMQFLRRSPARSRRMSISMNMTLSSLNDSGSTVNMSIQHALQTTCCIVGLCVQCSLLVLIAFGTFTLLNFVSTSTTLPVSPPLYNIEIYNLLWIAYFIGFSMCQVSNATFGLQGMKMNGVMLTYDMSFSYIKYVWVRAIGVIILNQAMNQALPLLAPSFSPSPEYYLASHLISLPLATVIQLFFDSLSHNKAMMLDGLLTAKRVENEFEKKRKLRKKKLTRKSKGVVSFGERKVKGVPLRFFSLLLSFLVMSVYPTMIIAPHYAKFTAGVKIFIATVAHPILKEAIITFFRHKNSKNDELRKALAQARKHSLIFFVESFLNMLKWFLILQIGKFEEVCMGATLSALGNIAFCASVNRRDKFIRTVILRKDAAKEDELLPKLNELWATSIFYSMVSETSAIFISCGLCGLLSMGPNRLAFNLGYEYFDGGASLLIFVYSASCNFFSTFLVLVIKLRTAIDVLSTLDTFDHWICAFMFFGTALSAAALSLLSLKAIPSMVSCDSALDPCTCDYSLSKVDGFCDFLDISDGGNTTELAPSFIIPDYYDEGDSTQVYRENLIFSLISVGAFVFLLLFFRTIHVRYKLYQKRLEVHRMEASIEKKELSEQQQALVKQIMVKQMTNRDGNTISPHGKKDALSRLQIPVYLVTIVQKNIGSGAFGDVHKAKYNGVTVAVKTLNKVEEDTLLNFKHEIMLMNQLRHPNIILLMGAVWSPELVGIVIEFAAGGSLSDSLKKASVSKGWNWEDPLLKIANDIAQGMSYLHGTTYFDDQTGELQECVLHRDLKPGNVLLTSTFTAKVSDFGQSRGVGEAKSRENREMEGTPIYMAPEIVKGDHDFGPAADVYSFGILLYAMTCPKGDVFNAFRDAVEKDADSADAHLDVINRPSQRRTMLAVEFDKDKASSLNIMKQVAEKGIRPDITDSIAPALKTLITNCWAQMRMLRPTFVQIVEVLDGRIRTEIFSYAETKKEASEAKLREEVERKKDVIRRCRSVTRDINFAQPVILLRSTELLRLQSFKPFEEVTKDASGELFVELLNVEEMEGFLKNHHTVYISHEWLSYDSPDPQGYHFAMFRLIVEQLSKANSVAMSDLYIWFDYCCLPQAAENKDKARSAVSQLPVMASIFQSFVVMAPNLGDNVFHNITGDMCNLSSYKMRASCRAEVLSFACKGGTMCDLWIATSKDEKYCTDRNEADIKKLPHEEYADFLSKADLCNVFGGEFTCCKRNHAVEGNPTERCDKEDLFLPMLGLYCDLYKRRFNPNVAAIFDLIEPRKLELYPSELTIKLSNNKLRYATFFDDLINTAEKGIDFENMVEAASGESVNTIRSAAEKSLIEEDTDLSAVLIDEHDLQIPESKDSGVLGQGGFGKVLLGKYRGHEVAVKQMRTDVEVDELHDNLARFRQECLFMKELKHENIVMLIGAVWSETMICCIMEYVSGGSLKDILGQRMDLTWTDHKLDFCIGVCRGMNYLHTCVFFDSTTESYKEGVIHRDLKPENVLLTETHLVKIADFGESRIVNNDATMTVVGTAFFMAPEVYRGERYDKPCDVFSYGMCLVEMCQVGNIQKLLEKALVKENPNARFNKSRNRLLTKLQTGQLKPLIPDDCDVPKDIRDLIDKCLQNEANDRPTFEMILSEIGKTKDVGEQLLKAEKESQDAQEKLRAKMKLMEEMTAAYKLKRKNSSKNLGGPNQTDNGYDSGSDIDPDAIKEVYEKLNQEVKEIDGMSKRSKKIRFGDEGKKEEKKVTKEEFLTQENHEMRTEIEQMEKKMEEMRKKIDDNITMIDEIKLNRISMENVRRGSMSEVSNPFANILAAKF